MSVLRYWTGSRWEIVPTIQGGGGGGGTVGPPGPPGTDGQSVEVFGPQTATPTPFRKGDVWLQGTSTKSEAVINVVHLAEPTPVKIIPLSGRGE